MLHYFETMLQRPNCLLNQRNRYQFLATIIVNIITFSHGIGVGWLAPTLRKLQSEDSPVGFRLTTEELSWVGSALGIGSILGNLNMGFLLHRFGRKICIYIIAVPHTCLWILIYCAQSVEYLCVGRILAGISGGGGYIVLPIYLSEIADTNIRGTLGSMVMLSVNLGVLIGNIIGSSVDYYVVPFIIVILPLTYFILNLFFPETPHFLIKQGQYTAAEQSFMFYKNIKKTSSYNELQNSMREFQDLKAALTKDEALNVSSVTYKDFLSTPALKAFLTALVVLIANQFSGLFAFTTYMSDVFAASGTKLDPNDCTMIIGIVQILGVYTTTLLCDIYGRKILMLVSSLGVSLSLVALGCYTHFSYSYDLSAVHWLPLAIIALHIFLGNIGLVGCFLVVLVEVFPAKIRPVANSFAVLGCSILVFTILKIFPIAMAELGFPMTMWILAGTTGVCFIYLCYCLEETKGKSMTED